jgi:hypothetical protein
MTAAEIMETHGLTILPKWTGLKPLFHLYHQHQLVYLYTYPQYMKRIYIIATMKPSCEQKFRLQLIQPARLPIRSMYLGDEWIAAAHKLARCLPQYVDVRLALMTRYAWAFHLKHADTLRKVHDSQCDLTICNWDHDTAHLTLPQPPPSS